MPRSWHSFTSYLSCIATGSPHLLQNVGVFLLKRAALVADHIASLIRIGDHGCAAIAASRAQMVQPLKVAALTLPVADRVVHETPAATFHGNP